MPFSNLQLMRDARRDLAPHWGLGVLVAFVYNLIMGIPSNIISMPLHTLRTTHNALVTHGQAMHTLQSTTQVSIHKKVEHE